MSSTRLSLLRRFRRTAAAGPQVCAENLGCYIRMIRLLDDRPLEQIAPLAGLTVPEWLEIEAGQSPDTWEQVCLIAQVFGLSSRTWRHRLMRLWAGAQQK